LVGRQFGWQFFRATLAYLHAATATRTPKPNHLDEAIDCDNRDSTAKIIQDALGIESYGQ
jgi:hypothetical protein